MVSPPQQETAIPNHDFGEANLEQPAIEEPSTSLMGMMDANGREHIEYPANSGRLGTVTILTPHGLRIRF